MKILLIVVGICLILALAWAILLRARRGQDSMAALRTALGLDGFDPERRELSDYNCDGAISVEDAVAIAKKVMHIV